MKYMRQPTLETLGLGSVIEIFQRGRLPQDAGQLVDKVFGPSGNRGALVISGVNGIVGAGKAMQLGSRLAPFGVPIVGLDFPGVSDGLSRQYDGLLRAFGSEGANTVMSNLIRLTYDGKRLPQTLIGMKPRFLLEAIPEILEIKRAHYGLFRQSFPGIEIRSVTSGFPSSELGVGVAHPSFPHEINKIWEIVEPQPSAITQLYWALGLIPVPVADRWSFILDVLFCGVTLAALRYQRATNMPHWKVDKAVRRLLGPNPFRAHDAIGAKGANFLTWSCLHHLAEHYGEVFRPTPELEDHKSTGMDWYPLNHFRPVVNWPIEDDEELVAWICGPLFQMASLIFHENRGHLTHVNAIGELCAQFRRGIVALIRSIGVDAAIARVEAYHRLHPQASKSSWYPDALRAVDSAEGQQLYVNAEHDGEVGVITISRESYNWDVDVELNRAIDWLKAGGIKRVIVTGDFHLSTQMVGADTSDFFSALVNLQQGEAISSAWSRTARRLNDEFEISVGFINGKRCLGGFLELLMHCHYLVARDDSQVGMPEATIPVVPGMEGCHWCFRKADVNHWPNLMNLLLTGKAISAKEASGWLVDYAGSLEDCLQTAWTIASGKDHPLPRRKVSAEALSGLPSASGLAMSENGASESARKAIFESIRDSCGVALSEALDVQARHSADFMTSAVCRAGRIGQEYAKVMSV